MEQLCPQLADFGDYEKRCAAFLKDIGSFEDGHAAEALAKRIEEICHG